MFTTDVLIIGAGPAGLAATIALRQRDIDVIVLERSPSIHRKVGEVVPPQIKNSLDRLHLWKEFTESGHLESPGLFVAWNGRVRTIDHFYTAHSNGWHLDRAAFDQMLLRKARESGATMLVGTLMSARAVDNQRAWEVAAHTRRTQNQIVHARILIDASGRSSRFAIQQTDVFNSIGKYHCFGMGLRPRQTETED